MISRVDDPRETKRPRPLFDVQPPHHIAVEHNFIAKRYGSNLALLGAPMTRRNNYSLYLKARFTLTQARVQPYVTTDSFNIPSKSGVSHERISTELRPEHTQH